jgi:hypothetical protein
LYASIPTHVERQMVVFPTGHHNDLARFARYHRILRTLLTVTPVRKTEAEGLGPSSGMD